MIFRFYTSTISRASRTFAAGMFVVGLLLIGFGLLIYVLPRLFATLAAIVFFVAGAGCAATAVRIFLAQRQLDKATRDETELYRDNVRIHIDDMDDF